MILHIVLFEPRPDLSDTQRQEILDDLRRAATAIPSLRRCRIGRRILLGTPGYEGAMTIDYQYAAIMEFDDRAGLDAYLRHPAHEAAGRHFAHSSAHALAYDYDVTDIC